MEDHRLKQLENKLLGRIWDISEVAERWRKLHNEEFHNLHSSPNTNCLGDPITENEMHAS
jgi:hypothetical protein